jgi:hypothetical protein
MKRLPILGAALFLLAACGDDQGRAACDDHARALRSAMVMREGAAALADLRPGTMPPEPDLPEPPPGIDCTQFPQPPVELNPEEQAQKARGAALMVRVTAELGRRLGQAAQLRGAFTNGGVAVCGDVVEPPAGRFIGIADGEGGVLALVETLDPEFTGASDLCRRKATSIDLP